MPPWLLYITQFNRVTRLVQHEGLVLDDVSHAPAVASSVQRGCKSVSQAGFRAHIAAIKGCNRGSALGRNSAMRPQVRTRAGPKRGSLCGSPPLLEDDDRGGGLGAGLITGQALAECDHVHSGSRAGGCGNACGERGRVLCGPAESRQRCGGRARSRRKMGEGSDAPISTANNLRHWRGAHVAARVLRTALHSAGPSLREARGAHRAGDVRGGSGRTQGGILGCPKPSTASAACKGP